jgi:hypothetical protein
VGQTSCIGGIGYSLLCVLRGLQYLHLLLLREALLRTPDTRLLRRPVAAREQLGQTSACLTADLSRRKTVDLEALKGLVRLVEFRGTARNLVV